MHRRRRRARPPAYCEPHFHEGAAPRALQGLKSSRGSVPLEILHRALMALGCRAAAERAQVTAPAGLWIGLARIEPVAAGFELADHGRVQAVSRGMGAPARA